MEPSRGRIRLPLSRAWLSIRSLYVEIEWFLARSGGPLGIGLLLSSCGRTLEKVESCQVLSSGIGQIVTVLVQSHYLLQGEDLLKANLCESGTRLDLFDPETVYVLSCIASLWTVGKVLAKIEFFPFEGSDSGMDLRANGSRIAPTFGLCLQGLNLFLHRSDKLCG